MNRAQNYVDTELGGGKFGKSGNAASWVANSYLDGLKQVPSGQFTQKIVDAFFKKMGWNMEVNVRRDLVIV